jgi:hypothetical protein
MQLQALPRRVSCLGYLHASNVIMTEKNVASSGAAASEGVS